MSWRPTMWDLLRFLLVVALACIDASLLPRLGGVLPDLVLVVVVAAAMLRGPTSGALVGLLAGWVVDLVPPAGHPLGTTALVCAAAGGLAGLSRRWATWSPLLPAVVTAVAAVVVELSAWLVTAGGGGAFAWADAGWSVLFTTVVGALAVPALLRLERGLVRRRWA